MYSERERAQLVTAARSCKDLIKLAKSTTVLESLMKSSGDMFRFLQMKDQIYSADRLACALRQVAVKKNIKLEDVKFKPINEGGNAGGKLNIPKDTFLLFVNLKTNGQQIRDSSELQKKHGDKPTATEGSSSTNKGVAVVDASHVGQVAHPTGLFNIDHQPVLVKLKGGEENTSIEYENEIRGYKAKDVSKVLKVKDDLYTFVILRPRVPYKPNIPGFFKFFKFIERNITKLNVGKALVNFKNMAGIVAPDTRAVKCSLMFKGPEKTAKKEIKLDKSNDGVSIAVSLTPVTGEGEIKFLKKGDIFALTQTANSSITILTQIFCIEKDGVNESRIVLSTIGEPTVLSFGTKLGEAVLITEKNAELAVSSSAAQGEATRKVSGKVN